MGYYASSFIQPWRAAGVLLVFPAGSKLSSGTPGWPKGGFHGLNPALHKARVELQVCAWCFAQTASLVHRDLHVLRIPVGGFNPAPKLTFSMAYRGAWNHNMQCGTHGPKATFGNPQGTETSSKLE